MNERPKFPTLQAWMEHHGINQSQLARMAGISRQHMSLILSRSRRCKWELALRFEGITAVDARQLAEWPPKPVQLETANAPAVSEIRAPHSLEQAS